MPKAFRELKILVNTYYISKTYHKNRQSLCNKYLHIQHVPKSETHINIRTPCIWTFEKIIAVLMKQDLLIVNFLFLLFSYFLNQLFLLVQFLMSWSQMCSFIERNVRVKEVWMQTRVPLVLEYVVHVSRFNARHQIKFATQPLYKSMYWRIYYLTTICQTNNKLIN